MTRSSPGSASPRSSRKAGRVVGVELGHLRLDRGGDRAQGDPGPLAERGEPGGVEVARGVAG